MTADGDTAGRKARAEEYPRPVRYESGLSIFLDSPSTYPSDYSSGVVVGASTAVGSAIRFSRKRAALPLRPRK